MNEGPLRRQLREFAVPSPSETARARAKHRALLALQDGVSAEEASNAPASWRPAWFGVAALVLIAIAAASWFWPHGENLASDRQMLREVEQLFPHQLNALVQKDGQTDLSLTETDGMGSDQPVLLIFKRQNEIIRVLSFSGHRVCVPLGDRDTCFEVLETTDGGVILEGDNTVALASRHPQVAGYEFRARTLSL